MTMRRQSKIADTSNDRGFRRASACCQKAFDPRPGIGQNAALLVLVMSLAACATNRPPTSQELYDADLKKCDALAPPFDSTRAGEPDYLSQMNEVFTQQQKCYFQANVNLEGRDKVPASNLRTLQDIGGSMEPTGQRMMPAIAPSSAGSAPATMSTP
jgi:hypothetical protein